jgi:endonuclease III
MTSTPKTKTVDKLTLGKKLVALLKKRYHSSLPKQDRSVLDTLLFAICLEDASVEQAEKAFARLFSSFHDLNELRVSSISELGQVFEGSVDIDWRAHRVRNVLQYVFEKHFEFAFESLRRKTLELATKQLLKIRDLTPFERNYTLQEALGTHVVPVDRSMTNAAIWLGLVSSGESPEQAAESLKSTARKADVPVFSHYLRCLAVDPRLIKWFESGKHVASGGADPQTMIERLETLFKEADAAARKSGKKSSSARVNPRGSDGRDRAHSGPRSGRGSEHPGPSPARKKK